MSGEEVHYHLFAKAITDTPLIGLPILIHVCRITPEQVVEQAVVGHIGGTRNLSDVVHVRQARRQSSVHTEDLVGDNGSNGQAVEGVNKGLPHLDVAPPLAFVVKAVDSSHVGAFVVAAENEEVFGILQLVAEEKKNRLE